MTATYIPAIASQSLGRAAHHKLEEKLSLCSQYGFKAVEIFYEDLEGVARSLPSSYHEKAAGNSFSTSTSWQEQQLAAADYIHHLCLQGDLEVLCLQPFMNYDGLIDRKKHQDRIRELHFWILLAKRLHTDLIQIPSCFLPPAECTGDRKIIVADLQEVADIGLQQTPIVRFAYEALAWGTHTDLWEVAWDTVNAVDRPNFGTCLDTFNLAGRVYADPSAPSGCNPNAETDIQRSIDKLRTELDISKVFYVEAVDGERLEQPLVPGHPFYNAEQPVRMSWSRNARLFPMEERGYLPICEVLQAICDAGYQGHISLEFFSRTVNTTDPCVPLHHAQRAQVSWKRLEERMGWNKEQTEQKLVPSSARDVQMAPRYISTTQQHVSTLLEAH
jgi:4-hydroxyphenylpyruvate dioxygenase